MISENIKVAIASSGLGHVTRGIESWAADLARALVGRGIDVKLFKGGGNTDAGFECIIPCWHRHETIAQKLQQCIPNWLGWRTGFGSVWAIEQTTFALRLLRELRRYEIRLLHVQDPLVALIVQRASQLRLVSTRVILGHGTEESLEFIRKITYLQHLAPQHLEDARREGTWKSTWTAIPNFIDTDRFVPAGHNLRTELAIPSDAMVVLTVAAIKKKHKRIDYLIDEFTHLQSRHPESMVYLLIAGGWEADTDELVKCGRDKLGDRVRFLVRFPREKMPSLYRSANLFAFCSLKEMMPISLLEAAASGLPCIVHDDAVLKWVMGQGGTAIDMSQPGALAAELGRLLKDRDMLETCAKLARNHCVENFGRDRVVDQLLEYYRFVLNHDRMNAWEPAPDVMAVHE